ncbi:MAG: hypothetical protein ACRC6X_00270 [Culicoidibacterales bacterium]
MQQYITYLLIGYFVVVFWITNMSSQKLVKKYKHKKYMKRIIIIPVGFVIFISILFLAAYLLPDVYLLFVLAPFLCYYVGIVAHLTFETVASLTKQAEKMNPYSTTNQKKKK